MNNNKKEVKEKPKIDFIQVVLILLIGVCLIGFSIFFSTWLRWKNESANYFEVIALMENNKISYLDEGNFVEVEKLKNFSGIEITDFELGENEAIVLYCNEEEKNNCIYVDYNNFIEANSINPMSMMLFFSILCIIFLIIWEIRHEKKKLLRYCSLSVIFLILGISMAVIYTCQVMDYYVFVDDSLNVVNSEVIAYLKGDDFTKEFRPVSIYEVDGVKYHYFSKKVVKGNFNEQKNTKLTLYYDKEYHNFAEKKENLFDIMLIILIVAELLGSISYLTVGKKLLKRNDKNA